jgi:aspartate/methionine/tyrosine aminotransferase
MKGELRTFFMEDFLEGSRFRARFNLGESGARHSTVGEVLAGARVSDAEAARVFLGTLLRDSPNWGRDDLRDRIAALHPGASRDDVLVTTGTSEALFLLFRQLRPRKLALPMPAFQLLYEIPQAMDTEIVPLPVRWDREGTPSYDAERWEQIVRRERPDVLLVNSPHNPSGLRLEQGMDRVLDAARDVGATCVGDEHYRFLSADDGPLGATTYRRGGKSFVTGSFIKCLGCPGLRIGWCVGDRDVLARMQSEKNYTTHTVNPVTEWIAAEVLRDLGAPGMQAAHARWMANREVLRRFLRSSEHVLGREPRGGIVTSLAFRGVETEEEFERCMRALDEAGVFVLPLRSMELGSLEEHRTGNAIERGLGFRLGLSVEPPVLEEALATIEGAARAARSR